MAVQKSEKPSATKQKGNRDMILRALTDKKYRKMLEEKPQEALGARVTDVKMREISLVLATVRGLEAQIKAIGDELLCLNGPPCGIA